MTRNEDPSNYGTHSLRIGGRSVQSAAGIPREFSKQLGGWSEKSDCDLIYAWPSREIAKRAPALMVAAEDDNDAQLVEFLRARREAHHAHRSELRNLLMGM